MKTTTQIFIIIHAFLAGFLLLAFQQGWLVIRSPCKKTELEPVIQPLATKKKVTLSFWHQGTFKRETIDLLWHDSKAKNAELILNNWLTLLDEEHITEKKITLQSVLSTPSDILYLSFDRYPFASQGSIFDKLMWLEGLLKTIRENIPKVKSIQFLVHNKILIDPHLDFSKPWPINGFIA